MVEASSQLMHDGVVNGGVAGQIATSRLIDACKYKLVGGSFKLIALRTVLRK